MKIKAPAKFNLSLNIFPQKRSDGFYPVKFLNCQLELADEIEMQPSKKVEVICSHPQLKKENNLVYQAIQLLPKKKGIKIEIKKKIPIKSGLGGGSSDAATVINYLNKSWNLKLSKDMLLKIGQKLGMDVGYCLVGGLCLVSGVGEKIKKLNFKIPEIPLVVIVPKEEKPSTAWAYQSLDCQEIGRNEKKLVRLIEALKKKDIWRIAENLHNDFEYSMEKKFPIIEKIKNDFKNQGALQAMLCGSGLAVFGMFEEKTQAQKAYKQLKKNYQEIFLTRT